MGFRPVELATVKSWGILAEISRNEKPRQSGVSSWSEWSDFEHSTRTISKPLHCRAFSRSNVTLKHVLFRSIVANHCRTAIEPHWARPAALS
jgi:hypothetical protein